MSVPPETGAGVDAVAAALADGRSVDEVLDLVDGALERASELGDAASLARLSGILTEASSGRSDGRGLAIAASRARAAAQATAPAAAQATAPAAAQAAAPAEALPPPASEGRDVAASAPPPDLSPAPTAAIRYSGWWRRALAYTIDWLVLLTVIGLAVPDSDGGAAFGFFVLPFAYFTILHALSRGQTLGKAVLGIAVRRDDGGLIGLSSALVRSLVQELLWITIVGGIVDSLMPLGDARRRSLHDRAATTVVLRVR